MVQHSSLWFVRINTLGDKDRVRNIYKKLEGPARDKECGDRMSLCTKTTAEIIKHIVCKSVAVC
jgi:hypothetical protein